MAIKLDKVIGRLREKDEHKCAIEVSCAVPQVTLEMQLRKVTEIAVGNRRYADGNDMGTGIYQKPPKGNYTVKRKARGEWVIYVRYFGDASTLENPKIGIIHKSNLYKCSQTPNPNYGVEGNADADIQVFVQKTQMQGMWLMHDAESNPILFDLPANEGEWTPLMQVDEFVEKFMYFTKRYKNPKTTTTTGKTTAKKDELNYELVPHHFKNRYARIGDNTKWSEFNINVYKASRRALYTYAGLAVVQERIFADQLTGYNRTAYAYAQPTYFTMRYAPKCETPYNILL